MDMVDMAMDMDMDTMVKQYLFISFSKFCCIHWNLLEPTPQKHRPLFKKDKNSFFEIKSTKLTELCLDIKLLKVTSDAFITISFYGIDQRSKVFRILKKFHLKLGSKQDPLSKSFLTRCVIWNPEK